jgi:hypothetical protein
MHKEFQRQKQCYEHGDCIIMGLVSEVCTWSKVPLFVIMWALLEGNEFSLTGHFAFSDLCIG